MSGGRSTSKIRGFVARIVVVALAATAFVLTPIAAPVAHAGSLLWPNGSTFKTFGPNEAIKIDLGTISYTGGCSSDGYDDFFYAFADVYIVAAGSVSVGDALVDVGGVENTVMGVGGGLFIDETIGYTGPAGQIPQGTYAIVYDECQDGRLDGNDSIFDPAFEVIIPADVPPAPPSLFAAKGDAASQRDSWLVTCGLFELITFIADNAPGPGSQRKVEELVEEALGQFTDALSNALGVDPVEGTKQVCFNMVLHYDRLFRDPADPTFDQVTTLAPRDLPGPAPSNDPVVEGLWNLIDSSTDQSALVDALVTAAERYQGADAAGDGDAALRQARDLRDYVALTRSSLASTAAAADDAASALAADPRDLDAMFADFAASAGRWVAGNYNDDERRAVANLGLPSAVLDKLSIGVTEVQVPFDRSLLQAELDGMPAEHAAIDARLATLQADLDGIIAYLESQGVISDELPIADAGGPYTADEGADLALDAAGSVAPAGVASYEWDLDGDGDFDDAVGPNPTMTVTEASSPYVGVLLTDTLGQVDVDYALISVGPVNAPPEFTSIDPSEGTVAATTGVPTTVSVTTDDPDGDPVTVTWAVDGVTVGTGPTFDWTPAAGDVGLHLITATASDGLPTGGARTVSFTAVALPPDADGDDWTANTDCDDADPAVNPGQAEVPFNGVDDDCSPFTPDAGEAPIAEFTSAPEKPTVADLVSFTDASIDPDGTIVAWSWDFGDGATSSDQNPTHTFASVGVFTVTLEVSDDEGFKGATSAPITVTDPDAPVADFDVSAGPWIVGNPISFTDASVDPNGGGLVSWDWDFGDGGTSTLQNPTHTYSTPGEYDVTLFVTDVEGKSGGVIGTLRVQNPTQPPTASFTFLPADPDELELVLFTNTSSDPDGDAMSFVWDFGDGTTSTDPSPTHVYSLEGTYPVTLVAVDVNGAADVFTSAVTVAPPPTAPVVDAGPDRPVDEGSELRLEVAGSNDTRARFDDRNSGDTHTATIDWGDGSPVESVAAGGGAVGGTHTYPDDGVHVVEVCVTDSSGLTGCDSFQVTVGNLAPDVSLTDLNRWVAESYPAVGGFPSGVWQVADDGLTVEQVRNGQPTLFLSEFDVFNTEAVVNISVTGGDDDFIGFVLGFDPGDTSNASADYLLVDWKGGSQSFNFSESCGTPGGTAPRGIAVSRVTGIPTADELWSHSDFDQAPCSPLGWGVQQLARANTLGSTGWSRNVEYEFRIQYGRDRLQIRVNDVLEFDLAGDFPPGRLGFYNFSQANVVYRAFDLEAAGGIEGSPLSLTGSFKDDGIVDTHTGVIEWGDGTPLSQAVIEQGAGSGSATAQHTYAEDGTYLSEVCVTDDDDGVGCDQIEVRIANARPVVDAGPDVVTGGDVTLAPATFTDAGVEDTHTATVDWGDGTVEPGAVDQGAGAGSVAATHTYAAPGGYVVEVCVTDDELDTGCDTFDVTVSDPTVPEVVDIEAGHVFAEGSEHTHWLSFSDADADTVHTVTVDWGDGTAPADAPANEFGGFGNVFASHTYADDGEYAVTWTICDPDGCVAVEVIEQVTNVAPVVDAVDPFSQDQLATGTIEIAAFTDAGTADTHTATIDWGDGAGAEPASVVETDGSGTVAGEHTYASPGDYPVEVCVTDDEGDTGCDTTLITVEVPLGTIIIVKESDPPGGTGFGFTSDVTGHLSFELDDGDSRTMSDVAPGSYTVTEDDPAPEYALDALSCDDGDSTADPDSRSVSIQLAAGETVTCTFTNVEVPPQIDTDLGVSAELACADSTDVSVAAPCDVDITVTNDGAGPVDATVVAQLGLPDDCVSEPALATLAYAALDDGAAVTQSQSFAVTCSDRSFHAIDVSVVVTADDPLVVDPDPSNDAADDGPEIVEVFQDAAMEVTDVHLVCDETLGDATFECTATVEYAKTGPAPGVEVALTAELAGTQECVAGPDPVLGLRSVLDDAQTQTSVFTWAVSCTPSSALHPFSVTVDIAPTDDEPHAVDEPGPQTDHWVVPTCSATVNPHGRKQPQAPGTGMNEDGFYVFGTATLGEPEQVYIRDDASGVVFGPFDDGTRIKWVEANGAEPRIKAMGANNGDGGGSATAVDYQIHAQGDAQAFFVDERGIEVAVTCLAPPFPK
jgi:PKD repeat protein